MQNDHDIDELLKTLTDNFTLLADEVQLLSDRKTILEHKLRFAHEQYQHLADKYAPADPEISSTLAKLQLPPELQLQSPDRVGFVPLPSRKHTASKTQTAVAIRDGRQASHKLAVIRGLANAPAASGRSITGTSNSIRSNSLRASRRTTLSTVLEQDFTVPGKKSDLKCPYAPMANTKPADVLILPPPYAANIDSDNSQSDHKPHVHRTEDPICAAMYAESLPPQARSQAPSASGSAPKCPIRFLDQHSPEEVARYFETHKHEIPRSHEVCVKRYQRNEDDIRKLDAKYGNLVSMIQGLGHKHQPMLPADEDEELYEHERKSNERVENWANQIGHEGTVAHDPEDQPTVMEDDDDHDREGRFERPLKEIRVGESPSRPWGISVPYDAQPVLDSRPASPVDVSSVVVVDGHEPEASEKLSMFPRAESSPGNSPSPAKPQGKCPFGFDAKKDSSPPPPPVPEPASEKPKGCPFDHIAAQAARNVAARDAAIISQQHTPQESHDAQESHAPQMEPTFINPESFKNTNGGHAAQGAYNGPPMVFTGPVFIGYPIEQAMQFMQQFQGMNKGMNM